MRKTLVCMICGGAAALALSLVDNVVPAAGSPRAGLAWEQPPIIAPQPGGQIIIIKAIGTSLSLPA